MDSFPLSSARSYWTLACLWPLAMLLNPLFSGLLVWNKGLGAVLLNLAVLFFIGFWTYVLVLQATAFSWQALRVEGDRLLLKPGRILPGWMAWVKGPHRMTGYRDGHVEIPLSQASLEWVGRTLYLHGQPDQDIRLGRGPKAQQMVAWLVERGVKAPVDSVAG